MTAIAHLPAPSPPFCSLIDCPSRATHVVVVVDPQGPHATFLRCVAHRDQPRQVIRHMNPAAIVAVGKLGAWR